MRVLFFFCVFFFTTAVVNAQTLGNAVLQGDSEKIQEYLQRGDDPNGRNAFGVSLFYSACSIAPKSAIELLLANGGDPRLSNPVDGQTPLMVIIRRFGDVDLVDKFLKRGADVNAQSKEGWTALMDAASVEDNSLEMSKKLLNAGANIHARNQRGGTALFWARTPDTVNLLVLRGVAVNDVDADGDSALLIASKSMQMDVMGALLRHGANVNVRNKRGETPLLVVLRSEGGSAVGDFASSTMLLDAGADPKAVAADGATALMYAVNEIDIGEERKDARGLLVKQLLRKGANVNAQDASGVNALMLAAGKGNANATKFLLQNGADPNRVDRDGATPLMWAAGGPNLRVFREIAALLLSAGADANYKRKDGKTVFDHLDESSKLEFRKLMAQRQD